MKRVFFSVWDLGQSAMSLRAAHCTDSTRLPDRLRGGRRDVPGKRATSRSRIYAATDKNTRHNYNPRTVSYYLK